MRYLQTPLSPPSLRKPLEGKAPRARVTRMGFLRQGLHQLRETLAGLSNIFVFDRSRRKAQGTRSCSFDLTVARTIEQVRQLRSSWEEVKITDIDATFDFFSTVIESSPLVERPHVVSVRRDGHPPILIVGRVESVAQPIRLGYHAIARPNLRTLVVSFGGLVGISTESDAQLIIHLLHEALAYREFDAVLLPRLEPNCLVLMKSPCSFALHRRGLWARPVDRWILDKPRSMETYLASKSSKVRQQLLRYDRNLRTKFGDGLTVRRFTNFADFHQLNRDLDLVAKTTYQYHLGAGVTRNVVQNALLRAGLQCGRASVWILYILDHPVSFWCGHQYNDTFVIETPGFDPAYSRDRVGQFAMMRMFEDLFSDDRLLQIDFGRGDAEYKRRAGATPVAQHDLWLYAARPYPVFVNLASYAAVLLNAQLRWLIEAFGSTQRLRRFWRKHLTETK